MQATIRCPAKLNLTFDILSLRKDGYHDVESIFQSITLEDELHLSVEKAAEKDFQIHSENPRIKKMMPMDRSNLMGKAAELFLEKLRPDANYKIEVLIEKKIPIGAGLAGGSSNAAGILQGLNKCFENIFSPKELSDLAAQIGSDVPFCLKGGTCIGRARGEILEEIPCKLKLSYCIVKPRKLSVSTPWAFKKFDEYKQELDRPKLNAVAKSLKEGDLEATLCGLGNVFEKVIFSEHPELAELKQELLKHGAWACHMTGSGPTLFAVVAGREMGHQIRRQILHDDDIGFVYGTEDIILEALPPIDFRLAENSELGARVISSN
ncbi:MAG: 4-(cytidine 5'-diphospho)-2-C-methyl-D-erythritol kinase [Candidatus Obscuribacterales bacterium]|nr:4-(cytidine 5'-diphospho)-2-C-methyl-D-erythritol kinase [Candidatus Obscuribacterales bacterium]